MASTYSFTSTGATSYDISYQIDWHSNALLADQATAVQVNGVDQTFGTDYTFDENTRYILFTTVPSSGDLIYVERQTPSTFYAQTVSSGAAPASVMLSNDEQVMKRIEEVEASISSNIVATGSIQYNGNDVTTVTVSGDITPTYNGATDTLDLSVTNPTVAQYAGSDITEIVLGSNMNLSSFSNGQLTLVADINAGAGTVTEVNGYTGSVTLVSSDIGAASSTDFTTFTNTTAPATYATIAALANKVEQSDIDASLSTYSDTAAMNTAITTEVGNSLLGYNVKEITAGTGITVTPSAGNYTITSDAAAAAAPTGSMTMWCGDSALPPAGWLICDGSIIDAVSDTSKQALFDTIGTAFSGDLASPDNSNFRLPDMREKFPFGANLDSNRGDVNVRESVTLTTNNLPSHSHGVTGLSVDSHSHSSGTLKTVSHSHSYSGTATQSPGVLTYNSYSYLTSASLQTQTQNSYSPTPGTINWPTGISTTASSTNTISGYTGAINAEYSGTTNSSGTLDVTGSTSSSSPGISGSLSSTGNNLAFPITPSYVGIHFIIKT